MSLSSYAFRRMPGVFFLCLALGLPAAASAAGAAAAYQPQPVAVPSSGGFVLPDGSLRIVGNDGMEDLVGAINRLFMQTHPGVRFSMVMKGSSTAMPALTAGVSLMAPMSRELWAGDRSAFRQVHGYEPVAIRIGYSGWGPRPPAKTPPAVYVHPANPLAGLSMQQLAQVFTAGVPAGDLNTWGQLGLPGAWQERRIHVFGLRDDGGFATAMRQLHFAGRPFAPHYEALGTREAVIRAVAADPCAIGLIGWMDASKVSANVRVLPLGADAKGPFRGPGLADVSQGRYPLSAPLQFYVNQPPGQPMNPLVREYLRLALSAEGQALVAAQTSSEEGYVPLSPEDLQAELKKLKD